MIGCLTRHYLQENLMFSGNWFCVHLVLLVRRPLLLNILTIRYENNLAYSIYFTCMLFVHLKFLQLYRTSDHKSANLLNDCLFQSTFERWTLDDAARAELPLTEDYADTFPVGVAVDFSSQYAIPVGKFRFLSLICFLCRKNINYMYLESEV